MIQTQPNKSQQKREFFLIVFGLTFLGAIPFLLLGVTAMFWLKGAAYKLPPQLLAPFFILGGIPGFFFGLWFARKQSNKQCWQLTDTALISGTSRQQFFPLSSIRQIIVGLPPGPMGKIFVKDKPGSATSRTLNFLSAANPNANLDLMRRVYLPLRQNSFLICFDDGSWLPLCLYWIPNGPEIMHELKTRLPDRVVEHHEYTDEEIRRIRKRDINELIPPP